MVPEPAKAAGLLDVGIATNPVISPLVTWALRTAQIDKRRVSPASRSSVDVILNRSLVVVLSVSAQKLGEVANTAARAALRREIRFTRPLTHWAGCCAPCFSALLQGQQAQLRRA